jgi:hypothetical protein
MALYINHFNFREPYQVIGTKARMFGLVMSINPPLTRLLHICSIVFQSNVSYWLIVDGTFCQAALDAKYHIREQVPAYLQGSTKLLTTRCVFTELEALGEDFLGAKLVTKRFQYHKCKHRGILPAAECVASMIGMAPEGRQNGGLASRGGRAGSTTHPVPLVPVT